jgi:hypothetical protein
MDVLAHTDDGDLAIQPGVGAFLVSGIEAAKARIYQLFDVSTGELRLDFTYGIPYGDMFAGGAFDVADTRAVYAQRTQALNGIDTVDPAEIQIALNFTERSSSVRMPVLSIGETGTRIVSFTTGGVLGLPTIDPDTQPDLVAAGLNELPPGILAGRPNKVRYLAVYLRAIQQLSDFVEQLDADVSSWHLDGYTGPYLWEALALAAKHVGQTIPDGVTEAAELRQLIRIRAAANSSSGTRLGIREVARLMAEPGTASVTFIEPCHVQVVLSNPPAIKYDSTAMLMRAIGDVDSLELLIDAGDGFTMDDDELGFDLGLLL